MKNEIEQLKDVLLDSDAILIGAGSGMSAAAGMDWWYQASPVYKQHFGDFYARHPEATGIFNGFYARFTSENERWAYLVRMLDFIYHQPPVKNTYQVLKDLIQDRPYHILTTNQDAMFNRYFADEQISTIQGDWRFLQSSAPQIDDQLYDARPFVKRGMEYLAQQEDKLYLPDDLIPHSPTTGLPLTPWVRSPEFLEGRRFKQEHEKTRQFINRFGNQKLLFFELGVGRMTPMFIQEPFWQLTSQLPLAHYVNINPQDAMTHTQIASRSVLIDADVDQALRAVQKLKSQNPVSHQSYLKKPRVPKQEPEQQALGMLEQAPALLITAANGFSISEGFNWFASDAVFHDLLGDLVDQYGLHNMLEAVQYPYQSKVVQWRVWARIINRYSSHYHTSPLMENLRQIIKGRPYYIWTTNPEHHFNLAGLDHVVENEANWVYGSCQTPDHPHVDLRAAARLMVGLEQERELTEADLPRCTTCGEVLTPLMFAPKPQLDSQQVAGLNKLVRAHADQPLAVLELGVGDQNPLVKKPVESLLRQFSEWNYVVLNQKPGPVPFNLQPRTAVIQGDLKTNLAQLERLMARPSKAR